MPFSIEFNESELTEQLKNPYKNVSIKNPLGFSFMEFLSLGKEISSQNHIYFNLIEDRLHFDNDEPFFYLRIKEFIDLGIQDRRLFSIDSFMYFLNIIGGNIPYNRLEFNSGNNNFANITYMSHLEEALRCFILSNKNNNAITSVFTCDSVEDVCYSSLYEILKLGFSIKICKNCGKYFIPYNRSDAIYCDRYSPQDGTKTCKEYGALQSYKNKLNNDEVEKLYRNIYMAKQMQVKRNPDIIEYKENFDKWKLLAKKWKSEIKVGTKTSDEFSEWLYSTKNK